MSADGFPPTLVRRLELGADAFLRSCRPIRLPAAQSSWVRVMRIEPEIGLASIVLVGTFNPPILTPSWFGWHGLLTSEDVDAARLDVAHPQILRFEAEWFSLDVTSEKFISQTTNAPFVRLKDLVLRVFNEHLRSTPIQALGINREVHFCAKDGNERDRLGRELAPMGPWGIWGERLALQQTNNGMNSLTISQLNPPNRHSRGSINITVEKSKSLGPDRPGIYVRVNDHYSSETPSNLGPDSSSEIMNFLNNEFDESIRRSEAIIDHVMSLTRTE